MTIFFSGQLFLIVVAGHTIGTAEAGSALVSHKAVAEAAVIGKPDQVTGNVIKVFVILRCDHSPGELLKNELPCHVRIMPGPVAMPSEIGFVTSLPRTRSGRIMRRLLRAQEQGMDPGVLSTLEE
jgi:acetyl-CoA synthetase